VLCTLYLGVSGDGISVKTEPGDITEYHPRVDQQSITGRSDSLKSFFTISHVALYVIISALSPHLPRVIDTV